MSGIVFIKKGKSYTFVAGQKKLFSFDYLFFLIIDTIFPFLLFDIYSLNIGQDTRNCFSANPGVFSYMHRVKYILRLTKQNTQYGTN